MSDPTGPTDPAVPPPTDAPSAPPPPPEWAAQPAAAEPSPSAPPPSASMAAMGGMPTDPGSRNVVGAGAAIAVIALVGIIVTAWKLDWSGLILIAAGLVAAAAAWMTAEGQPARSMPIAARHVALAGGTVAAVLGVLFLAQLVTDLDDLDDYGGIVGAVVTILGAVAGVALYIVVIRRWFAGAMAPWMDASRSGLAARLVIGGAALATVGWLGNVTYGVWLFEAGSEVLTLILLAAIVAVAAADTDAPLNARAAVIAAIVLVAFAALIALQHTLVFIEEGFGIDDWIPQIAYVAGVVVQVIGVALWTRDEFSAEIASATASRPSDEEPTSGGDTAAM